MAESLAQQPLPIGRGRFRIIGLPIASHGQIQVRRLQQVGLRAVV